MGRFLLNDRFHGAGEEIVQVQAVALAVLDEGVGHAGQFSATSGSKTAISRTNCKDSLIYRLLLIQAHQTLPLIRIFPRSLQLVREITRR